MKILFAAVRVVLAIGIGALAFLLGLFIPLWTMMAVGKDPGNIGGGFLTLGIGIPIGLVCGIAGGWFCFSKTKFLKGSSTY